MADVICFDAETYYDKDYSLSKLTTEVYVNDRRFELIGCAIKINDGPTVWYPGKEFTKADIDWENSWVLAHNTLFDATILSYRFGIKPKLWLDTLSMGRALHGTEVGGSLKALAEHYGVGEKGTEVMNALGKRRLNFTEAELAAYAEYCKNDVDLTYEIFKRMAPHFNKTAIKLIDLTLRMHTEPRLLLDHFTLKEHLYQVQARKEELMDQVKADKSELMSNPMFAKALEDLGVAPPMKISARTGKETYAFAKSDEGMKALLDHENPEVQALVAARVGVKSTLEETRTQRFIEMAERFGKLPVPLKYYGAMTGRWAAADKTNLQNIPRGSKLKEAIIAPEGWKIVGADLSNVELRVGLYFAGQMDKLNLLAQGTDLYKDFASSVFGVGYDDVDDYQRFIGKTCIAEGELVLTEQGLVPIEKITVDDRVWDGIEWVQHDGVLCMGEKDVIEYQGLRATPDHIVYLEDGTSCEFGDAAYKRANIAITGIGGGSIQLLDNNKYRNKEEQQERGNAAASAMRLRTSKMAAPKLLYARAIEGVSCLRAEEEPHGAGSFDSGRQGYESIAKKSGSNISTVQQPERQRISKLWWAWSRVQIRVCQGASRIFENIARMGFRQGDRPDREQRALRAGKPSLCYAQGADKQSAQHFIRNVERKENPSGTVEREPVHERVYGEQVCPHGANRRRDLTGSLGFSGQEVQELANYKGKTRVYDIINAGPRHRFTVSNVLVSNCQLSLIYGTGANKLRNAIKMMSNKDIGEVEAKRIVDIYRTDYPLVKKSWYDGEKVLQAIRGSSQYTYGSATALTVMGSAGIRLPSDLYLKYPDLTLHDNDGKKEWTYAQRKERVRIHGPKCFQNTIQALAACIMGEAMLRIAKRLPVAITIHDAVYCVVPDQLVEKAAKFIVAELKREPLWAPGIPLDAEVGAGQNLAFKMAKLEKFKV